jgi:hypothetical protein
MKEFHTKTEAADFKIDDDVFHPPAEIPAGLWLDLIELQNQLEGADTVKQFELVTTLFEMVLPEDEYALFSKRLHDKARPIGMPLLIDVIEWLLGEAYGMRPTPPPSSSAGSSTTPRPGGPSTAGARRKGSPRSGSPAAAT